MTENRPNLGFLTAFEDDQGGFLGGYLATNHLGRPIEFQCTKPLRPNASQRILYGATLRPYLMGELIGLTLFEKATIKADLLFTDQQSVLALREHLDRPLVFLDPSHGTENNGHATPRFPWQKGREEVAPESLPIPRLACHSGFDDDRSTVEAWLRRSEFSVDLYEPFSRILEAIDETLQPSSLR